MQIKQQLVLSRALTNPGVNTCKGITVHETGNPAATANAQAHANLQSRGNPGTSSSWHWQVDDIQAIQSYPHDVKCWHAGDGFGFGNEATVGIELCVNADGDWEQAKTNLVELLVHLSKLLGIPVNMIGQHFDRSGKNCPQRLRANNNREWNQVIQRVTQTLGGSPVPAPTPVGKTVEQLAAEVMAGEWGNDPERSQRLTAAGYNAASVQAAVNRIYYGSASFPVGKTIEQLAAEVMAGEWGNDPERTQRLTAAGYNAASVQQAVNRIYYGMG